jgi:sugar lactone lactonase YvrE
MYYSNGVALAPDGSYILVAETGTLRILRHWLQGPKVLIATPPFLIA